MSEYKKVIIDPIEEANNIIEDFHQEFSDPTLPKF